MSAITVNKAKTVRIDEFAKRHGFHITINERTRVQAEFAGTRFYAHFDGVEEKDDCILRSASGQGNTPQEALDKYCRMIEGKLLVKDAYGKERQEVWVNCNLTTEGIEL
jgi:hypothetical protein